MKEEVQRVDESLLEFEDNALSNNGKPFTGVSVLKYPSGKLKKELSYVDGFPEGVCQEWHDNGTLKSKWVAIKGEAPAEVTEWFESGEIKSKKVSEHGVELEFTEWGPAGEIISSRKLEEGSSMHKFLERMRRLKASDNG